MKKVLFSSLKAEMARKGENYNNIGELLSITPQSAWRRLNGETNLTKREIDILLKHYNKTYEELFIDDDETVSAPIGSS